MSKSLQILCACALCLTFAAAASADRITDAPGDFIPTYTGPQGGDLDVTSAEVTFDGARFVFASTQAAPVGTTAGAFYVWGIDRGAGTARFGVITVGANTYDATGVLFDSVVSIRPGGASTVTDLVSGVTTSLAAADITISGNTISAVVPFSLLPSRGLLPGQYGVNLWPRFAGVTGNAAISDFAPNNATTRVTTVPEPATLVLLGTGLAGAALRQGRRRRTRVGG